MVRSIRTLVAVHVGGVAALARLRAGMARRSDRGSVTLEQVVIALGVFLLAVAVITGITLAVNTRLARIK